jgi:hypothetical protein
MVGLMRRRTEKVLNVLWWLGLGALFVLGMALAFWANVGFIKWAANL